MNKENLLKAADYIETVPQELFSMGNYRYVEDGESHECNSVGCILGHCTKLDEIDNIPRLTDGTIKFRQWSDTFFEVSNSEWFYLFSSDWFFIDNTPTGAAKRIRYIVEHGLPENWRKQVLDKAPLSYLNEVV